MKSKEKSHAVVYLRTSSSTNAEGDSQTRQRLAIETYAERAGLTIVDEFSDMAVNGDDLIEGRDGFAKLLDRIESNGVRIVLIEDASRLARALITQELAIIALIERGVRVLTANGDELTDNSDPSRVMMRQIAGAFHQYEKARLVAKLKAAKDRARSAGKRVDGRLPLTETNPEATALARKLSRKRPKGGQRSLREISAALAEAGHFNSKGKPFSPQSISNMLT
ncbi:MULTISPECIES: recombinase family protein [unclassified Bradyrhizobium]|uniref:recombinase family protein n=1 Tax=unclassified Bradyrhizobium TaxID=2631580 RepID=UPI00339128AF